MCGVSCPQIQHKFIKEQCEEMIRKPDWISQISIYILTIVFMFLVLWFVTVKRDQKFKNVLGKKLAQCVCICT